MNKKFSELSMEEINELVNGFKESFTYIDKDPIDRDKNEENQIRKLLNKAKSTGIRKTDEIIEDISSVSNEYKQTKNNFLKRLFNPKVNDKIDELKTRLNILTAEKKISNIYDYQKLDDKCREIKSFFKTEFVDDFEDLREARHCLHDISKLYYVLQSNYTGKDKNELETILKDKLVETRYSLLQCYDKLDGHGRIAPDFIYLGSTSAKKLKNVNALKGKSTYFGLYYVTHDTTHGDEMLPDQIVTLEPDIVPFEQKEINLMTKLFDEYNEYKFSQIPEIIDSLEKCSVKYINSTLHFEKCATVALEKLKNNKNEKTKIDDYAKSLGVNTDLLRKLRRHDPSRDRSIYR